MARPYSIGVFVCLLALGVAPVASAIQMPQGFSSDEMPQQYVWWQPPEFTGDVDPQILGDDWYAVDWSDSWVGDDFMLEEAVTITDVHWWGSIDSAIGIQPTEFLIGFYTDVAAGEDPDPLITWSHPGEVVFEFETSNFESEFVATYTTPFGDWDVYEYWVDLTAAPFEPEAGTVYWLVLQAQGMPVDINWGWHDSSHYWGDDAAQIHEPSYLTDDWTEVYIRTTGESRDMAFGLTIIPEPSTALFGGAGMVLLFLLARRRKI